MWIVKLSGLNPLNQVYVFNKLRTGIEMKRKDWKS